MTDTTTRPAELLISALDEIKQLNQWVVSKRIYRDGRVDKPPLRVSPTNKWRLIPASHSDPSQWMTHHDACRAACEHNGDAEAIGFVFSDHDPYSGIDFDGCRDPKTGAIEPWAKTWIDRLNSYTEISVSGTGVKTWVKGKLPKAVIHKLGEHKGIEIYSRQRYFWVTGKELAGMPVAINEAQVVLDAMVAELDPPKPKVEPKPIERKISKGEQAAENMALADCYALARTWLRDHYVLTTELENAGAKKTRSGYSCPFCTHTHTTTLTIADGGKVGYSHSPNCKLASRKGFDVTNVLILRGNYSGFDDMARALAPHCFPEPKGTRSIRTLDESPRYTTEQREAWRSERKARRHADAAAIRADVRTRASADDQVKGARRAVLDAMLDWADDHNTDCCWAGRATLARRSGYSLGSVKRAVMELEALGYFTSEGAGGSPLMTAKRTFTRGSCFDTQNTSTPKHDPRIDIASDLIPDPVGTCERATAATLDEWEWQADEHGADELNALETQLHEATTLDDPLRANLPPATQPADRMALVATLEDMTDAELRAWIAGLSVCKMHTEQPAEPEPDEPGASYDPNCNTVLQLPPDPRAVPSWLRTVGDIGPMVRKVDECICQPPEIFPEVIDPEPEIRCPPSDPALARRYYAIKAKAKKAASPGQRIALERIAAGMEEWRPFGDAPPSQALRHSGRHRLPLDR